VDVTQDNIPTPTLQEIKAARAVFEEKNPETSFTGRPRSWWDLALRGQTGLILTEATPLVTVSSDPDV
jgi:hypothetical protein